MNATVCNVFILKHGRDVVYESDEDMREAGRIHNFMLAHNRFGIEFNNAREALDAYESPKISRQELTNILQAGA